MRSEDCLPIEDARIDDVPEIVALQKLAFQKEAERTGDWQMPAQTQTIDDLASEFPNLRLFVIRDGGRIIATGRAKLDGKTVRMGRLAVAPDWQGRGLGTRLLCALEASFPDSDRLEIFTSDVSLDNIRLYERLGYHEFARKKVKTLATLVYMEKRRNAS